MSSARRKGKPADDPVRVLVGGTFDGLHMGHVFLLSFARRRGAALARKLGRSGVHLSVVIARDESVQRIKGRLPHHDQSERRSLIGALAPVDRVFVGSARNFLASVRRANPDLVVLGYDQAGDWEERLRRAGIDARVARCPSYHGHRLKSSRIRADLEALPT